MIDISLMNFFPIRIDRISIRFASSMHMTQRLN